MIDEQVVDAVRQFEETATQREELERFRAFLEEMQRAGLALKRGYDLPLVDTIGRTAHRIPRSGRR